jgi:hypothetical protein
MSEKSCCISDDLRKCRSEFLASSRPALSSFLPFRKQVKMSVIGRWTLARIASFVGGGEVGSPHVLDTHRPRGFVMRKFVPPEQSRRTGVQGCSLRKQAMRLFDPPKYASIRFRSDVPIEVKFDGKCGNVVHHAGPWLSSGDWWNEFAWNRKEWDVELQFADGNQAAYRIFLDLYTRQAGVEGSYD